MSFLGKEREIFAYLFEIAKYSNDEEGIVCACLTDDKGNILTSSPSFSDGRHAEYVVLETAKEKGIKIGPQNTIYTTLEPCGYRNREHYPNCTDLLILAGIKQVVYAAFDPEYSRDTAERFQKAGINYRQVADQETVEKAKLLFNSTIYTGLDKMLLLRRKKL